MEDNVRSRVFTIEEVRKHNTPDDCYTVIHGKVYDVTNYLNDHPGGGKLIMKNAGDDSTKDFEALFHSPKARALLEPMLVGELKGARRGGNTLNPHSNNNRLAVAGSAYGGGRQRPRSRLLHGGGFRGVTNMEMVMGGGVGGAQPRPKPRTGGYSGGPANASKLAVLQRANASLKQKREAAAAAAGKGMARSAPPSAFSSPVRSRPPRSQQDHSSAVGRQKQKAGDPLAAAAVPGRGMTISLSSPSGLVIRRPSSSKTALPVEPRRPRMRTYRLKGVSCMNHNTSVFSLQPDAGDNEEGQEGLVVSPGQHVYVCMPTKGGHLVDRSSVATSANIIKRAYTPISCSPSGAMEIMVKVYPDGVVSRYIHSLTIGDPVCLLGPLGVLRYKSGMFGSMSMLAAGTGIAPMYQLIRTVCEDPNDQTPVRLLYASRQRRDVLLGRELRAMAAKHPKQLFVQYVLSQPDQQDRREGRVLCGRIDQRMIQKHMPRVDDDGGDGSNQKHQAMICGTDSFHGSMLTALRALGWPEERVHVF